MKKQLFLAVAALFCSLTLFAFNAPKAKTAPAMQRIDKLIAESATKTYNGHYNQFLVTGAKVTPSMMKANSMLVHADKVSTSPMADSMLGIVMRHNNDVIATRKHILSILFPNVTKYILDGQRITRNDFNRIPEPLIASVSCEGNGTTLRITSRPTPDTYSAPALASLKAEEEWCAKNRPTPSKEQRKAEEQMKAALDNIVNQ